MNRKTFEETKTERELKSIRVLLLRAQAISVSLLTETDSDKVREIYRKISSLVSGI